MTDIVSVRFKDAGKVYYFAPGKLSIKPGQYVVVETARGVECAVAVSQNRSVEDSAIVHPLRPVLRIATEEDRAKVEKNRELEKEACEVCRKKIEEHGLEMSLSEAEYAFDGSKITFYFIGGLGICGRPFCCSQFLKDFHAVSIKMAKTQGISLSPGKISGSCGRLMCCLQYEQNSYEYLEKITPRRGSVVDCREGRGVVVDSSLVTGKLKVMLDSSIEGAAPIVVDRSECAVVSSPSSGKSGAKKQQSKSETQKN